MSEEEKMKEKSIIHGSFMDSNDQYTQDKKAQILAYNNTDEELVLWKNDKGIVNFSLIALDEPILNLRIELEGFTSDEGHKLDDVEIFQVQSTLAFTGSNDSTNRDLPLGNRLEANEILNVFTPTNLTEHSLINLWLMVSADNESVAGTYHGKILVRADNLKEDLVFNLKVKLLDLAIPESSTYFDLELWQNPFALAEYYNVEAFSRQHFSILEPHMELYKSLGGDTITATIIEEAWNGQTFGHQEVKFPSMIQWEMLEDNTLAFNYQNFDAWIEFNHSIGLGNKIICYSILPWSNQFVYYDHKIKEKKIIQYEIGDENYIKLWTCFLKDFISHVESKGWKDLIYMGIDERGFDQNVFNFLKQFVGKDELPLKTAGAIDHLENKKEIALGLDVLSVGTMAIKAKPNLFEEIRHYRSEMNKLTYTYSCTGHQPGNFSLSIPAESYWTILYSHSVGANGFLRWAFDSWVEDPLRDSTHRAFESGDCFMVYPDEKYAEKPVSRSSTRMEKLAEGIRDLGKLQFFAENHVAIHSKLHELVKNIPAFYDADDIYLTEAGKEKIILDIARIKRAINKYSLQISQSEVGKT